MTLDFGRLTLQQVAPAPLPGYEPGRVICRCKPRPARRLVVTPGGACGIRTRDLLGANETRCQLRQGPVARLVRVRGCLRCPVQEAAGRLRVAAWCPGWLPAGVLISPGGACGVRTRGLRSAEPTRYQTAPRPLGERRNRQGRGVNAVLAVTPAAVWFRLWRHGNFRTGAAPGTGGSLAGRRGAFAPVIPGCSCSFFRHADAAGWRPPLN